MVGRHGKSKIGDQGQAIRDEVGGWHRVSGRQIGGEEGQLDVAPFEDKVATERIYAGGEKAGERD